MDLRSLRYFVTVAEERNITHAAEKLGMSQPPLSNQMKNLEDELGTALFIRGKRRLQLTEAGQLLYRRAVQLLEMADKTREDVAALQDGLSGRISLALVEGRAPFLASRWIAGFREEFPNVRYSLWNGSSDDVLDRLDRGLADLAVVAAPYNSERLDGFTVGREAWVAMIPLSHPLAAQEGDFVKLENLADEALIIPSRRYRVDAIHNWFAEIDREPNILCELSHYLDAVALTEQGVGISIFPQTTYTPNALLTTKIITMPARQVEYALVWPKQPRRSPLSEEFIQFVWDTMEEERQYPIPVREYLPPDDTPYL